MTTVAEHPFTIVSDEGRWLASEADVNELFNLVDGEFAHLERVLYSFEGEEYEVRLEDRGNGVASMLIGPTRRSETIWVGLVRFT